MTESANRKWGLNDSIISGAGAGFVASVATCPLDVLKTKLQAQRARHGSRSYLGVAGLFKEIIARDGIKGLYRGLGPTILGYLPTWAIYFSVYDGIKNRFGEQTPEGFQKQKSKAPIYPAPTPKGYQPYGREHPWALHILSAMAAGACSTFATNPMWVIKTRFMTQSADEVRYRHTLDAVLTIYRQEGWRAFYRGLFPSLLGIAHVAVQFPLYEQLKILAHGGSSEPLSSGAILLCSGTAKMVASVTTYPHEVIRTRLQIHRRELDTPARTPGVLRTAMDVVTKEGWRGLYRGLSINLIRTVPNSAVTMLTYELLMRHLSHRA
ncbi:mitochondrial NAD transporter [Punctularia strigosozonata HHB-11173 SS5]|uniref:mitochondrial NAD transporter n=1 Tax=Punctularia strigosozonata (strain HHB-11173) TaxID=741275 RepID=UPI0004418640|nr:mitochondrial NAD transporter [Punctularia strigosozonata HHB-11173 SS5]EIN12582.1 mitochondrial NAD transporter [Punctularia strigosozonata HHB-11173 SS5]